MLLLFTFIAYANCFTTDANVYIYIYILPVRDRVEQWTKKWLEAQHTPNTLLCTKNVR